MPKAEKNAKQAKELLREFHEMFSRENDAKALGQVTEFEKDFDLFYQMGKKMADAYVREARRRATR